MRAVIEADSIEGRHRPQVDVLRDVATAQLPELFEEEWGGDDGRPGIEGEAVTAMHVGPPAGRVELLEDGDVVAACPEADRRSETAETGADHQSPRLMSRLGSRWLGTIQCQHGLTIMRSERRAQPELRIAHEVVGKT